MKNDEILECLDFECDMSLIDRDFLVSQSHETIKRIIVSLKVRKINNREHDTSKYCELDFYIVETLSDKVSIIAYFKREIYVIDDLRTKVLIDIDILRSKTIVLDVTRKQIIIDSCDVNASLFVTSRKKCVERKLRSRKQVIILAHTIMTISIKYRDKVISNNRNYSFLSRFDITLESSEEFFAHIVNANVETIQVRNVFNKIFIVSKNLLIEELQNYDEDECYLAHSKDAHLVVTSSSR